MYDRIAETGSWRRSVSRAAKGVGSKSDAASLDPGGRRFHSSRCMCGCSSVGPYAIHIHSATSRLPVSAFARTSCAAAISSAQMTYSHLPLAPPTCMACAVASVSDALTCSLWSMPPCSEAFFIARTAFRKPTPPCPPAGLLPSTFFPCNARFAAPQRLRSPVAAAAPPSCLVLAAFCSNPSACAAAGVGAGGGARQHKKGREPAGR